ncbi:MAG: TlpA disulfide reductase family protein [Flavobacteriaceae bacterium]
MKAVGYFSFLLLISFGMKSGAAYGQQTAVLTVNYQELYPMLHQTADETLYVVNFWATWCAPCVKELPFFEQLNRKPGVEVLLVSLDFPKQKQKRLLPFIQKHQLQSKVVLLDDPDEQFWINAISTKWSGALPATLIYNSKKRQFYEQSFTKEELNTIVNNF